MLSEVTLNRNVSGLKEGHKYEVVEVRGSDFDPTVVIKENYSTTATCNASDFYEKDQIIKEYKGH